MIPWRRSAWFSIGLLLVAIAVGYWLHEDSRYGREASFVWWIGIALGVVLQRTRFCFFCNLRETLEGEDVRPLLGILTALAVGTVGAVTIFGAWIPDATAGYLPQRGHIGPAAWPMLLGGLVFGLGMALSGSCISAHLYRLSEGSSLSPVSLLFALGGFALGDWFWNPLYLADYRTASVVWLPKHLGFGGALILQLAVLAALALWVWNRRNRDYVDPEEPPPAKTLYEALFVNRWPAWLGGALVGIIASAALFRTQPLGVTAELSRLGHSVAQTIGISLGRLEGIDSLRGCIIREQTAPLTLNALLVLGLVLGAFVASFLGGHFAWSKPPLRRVVSAAVGGLLLGVGSRIALGCTIGTLYGGITALSLSGWLFAGGMVAGIWGGLRLRRLYW